ncbi:MAG: hypothetical protein RL338_62 [Chloroflexota bacterium]
MGAGPGRVRALRILAVWPALALVAGSLLAVHPATAVPAAGFGITPGVTITSPGGTTFVEQSSGSFLVTTSATLSPVIPTLSISPQPPAGIDFVDLGDGTATLVGTPAPGTARETPYDLTITASGAATAVQSFSLVIAAAPPPNPPAFTSPDATTFTEGTYATFVVSATNANQITVSAATPLPDGLTASGGGGTANLVIGGAPSDGTSAGSPYSIVLVAKNGNDETTQTLRLTVLPRAPSFTSAASASVTEGTALSFAVEASGATSIALVAGALPTGIAYDATTRTLAGTPAAGSAGAYPLTFRATNAGGSADQAFTLTVTARPPLPSFTGPSSASVTEGTTLSVAIAATGATSIVLVAGALPTGIAYDATTRTLAGAPATGTAGEYPLTFRAENALGDETTRTFTLTVTARPPLPVFGEPMSASVIEGSAFAITVDASGAASIALESGAPVWLAYGDATRQLAGTAPLASAGTYPLTFRATNALGDETTRTFTLTVTARPPDPPPPPSFTSAASASVTEGTALSFAVEASGATSIALVAGSLPAGIAYDATTRTLAGTPAAGSAGAYPLTFRATNAGGSADQAFTLTVTAAPGDGGGGGGGDSGGGGGGGDSGGGGGGGGGGGIVFPPGAGVGGIADVAFTLPATGIAGGSVTLVTRTPSGTALAFRSETPTVCVVVGAALWLVGVGTCTVAATPAAGAAAGSPASRASIVVSRGTPRLAQRLVTGSRQVTTGTLSVVRRTTVDVRLQAPLALAGLTAELWVRQGGGAWRRLTTRRVNGAGIATYRFPTTTARTVVLQWRFAGTSAQRAATSNTITLRVR